MKKKSLELVGLGSLGTGNTEEEELEATETRLVNMANT